MNTLKIVLLLSTFSNAFSAEVLHYVLLSGSSIISFSNRIPASAVEALSGTFDWVQFDTGASFIGFDATNLHFQSQSFTLELNRTSTNDVGTSIFPGSTMTYFS